MIILYFLLLIIFLSALFSVAKAWKSLAPWVPARRKDLARIARLSKLKEGETFFDLGCGEGRVVNYIASSTKARAIGVEMAWPFFLICQAKAWLLRNPRIKYYCRNLYSIDLSKADVVFLFAASPGHLNTKLTDKLTRELKSGSRIISYAFALNGLRPNKVDKPSEKEIIIYLYKIL